ncbi:MAG: hypothetical protein QXE79_04725 [Candidatus Bathyarchaeia archaeon]
MNAIKKHAQWYLKEARKHVKGVRKLKRKMDAINKAFGKANLPEEHSRTED